MDDFAICVGISSYHAGTRLGALPGAVQDAREFHEWVTSSDGGRVPLEHAWLIVSPDPQDRVSPTPLAAEIEQVFRDLHIRGAESAEAGTGYRIGRRLYIYFAGHGVSLGEAAETVLLTAEARPPDAHDHVAGRYYAEHFRESGAFEEVILTMDCCRNAQPSVYPRRPSWDRQTGRRQANWLYVFAAVEGVAARELFIGGQPRGAMTHTLLACLRSAPPSGLSARQLADALYRDVPRVAPGVPRPKVLYDLDPQRDFVIARAAMQAAALESLVSEVELRKGRLTVSTEDTLARIDVWNSRGENVASGFGPIIAKEVPVGRYDVRATVAGGVSETSIYVGDHLCDVKLDPVPQRSGFFGAVDRRWYVAVRGLAATLKTTLREDEHGARLLVELPLEAGDGQVLSVPLADGFRTELFVDFEGASVGVSPAISVRVVPDTLRAGEPIPTDRVREMVTAMLRAGETLSLAHVERILGETYRENPAALATADPILALLTAAIIGSHGEDATLLVDALASVLGPRDPDLALLGGGEAIAMPPLLGLPWAIAHGRGTLATVASSEADQLAGRLIHARPWFMWSAGGPSEGFRRSVASATWPGWSDPAPADGPGDLAAAAKALCLPLSSVLLHAYKSPPIARLVQHEEVVFVGASNDQLAPAMAIAFSERKGRRWTSIDVWFLADVRLDLMVSAGRTGLALRRARNEAIVELGRLLPSVADRWRRLEYDGLSVDGEWVFASIWGGRAPGALIHVSAYVPGIEVRLAPARHQDWPAGSVEEPRLFAVMADAVARMPSRLIADSQN